MYNKWFNHKYNEGYTLVLAMFVIVIILSFGTVILNITLSEFKQSERYKNSLKAYFLARSGAELAADIILDPNNNKIMLEENEFALKDGNNNVIIKKIKVKKINNSSNFLITSTAEAGSNPVSKTVSLQINKNNLFDNTIFTKADLDISHNNSSVSGTIESNGQIIDPDDKVLEENKTENSNKKYLPVPEIPSETDFNNPNDGSVFNGEKIASNSYYTKININNDNLILDTTNGTENDTDDDKNITIVVEELDVKKEVIIKGEGLVKIYIKNKGEFKTPNVKTDQLLIFLAKDSKLTFQANSEFNGYVYGPEAMITMNSKHTTFKGAIIADTMYKEKGMSNNAFQGTLKYVKPEGVIKNYLDKETTLNYSKGDWMQN